MGVYEGRGQIAKSMKELLHRWSETQGDWDDAVSRAFEKRYLVPLEIDVRAATAALDSMAQMLATVRRDCGGE